MNTSVLELLLALLRTAITSLIYWKRRQSLAENGSSFSLMQRRKNHQKCYSKWYWISFISSFLKMIFNFCKQNMEIYAGSIIHPEHSQSKRVLKLANRILDANKDLPEIHTKNWTFIVMNDPSERAFSLFVSNTYFKISNSHQNII